MDNLTLQIYVTFFCFFSIIALPIVFIYYFVNLWLNKKNPDRELKQSLRPLSKFDKVIRSSAGIGMILLGIILAGWPFFAIVILKEPMHSSDLHSSENWLSLIWKLKHAFLLPIGLISVGLFYLKTGNKGLKGNLEN